MYEINERTIRFAYLKLKNYVYYYSSSNYLKEKLMKFEDDLKSEPTLFKKYANELNQLAEKEYDMLDGYKFDYIAYPKKDSFVANNDKIDVENVNLFIDTDLIFYLNDVLFCFELYDVYKSLNQELFFGNLFNKHLKETNDPLYNRMLFDAYWGNYNKWKKSIANKVSTKKLNKSSLVKIDFERCYYQTRFNIEKILSDHGLDLNNPIINIAINVYRLYSSKIYSVLKEKKEENQVLLPLGLPSSSVLQNIIFSDFDKKINDDPNVIAYSRYVDDILILVNKEIDSRDKFYELISGTFNKIGEDGKVFVDVSDDTCLMNLNKKKIEIRSGTSVKSLVDEIERIVLPSMVDEEEEENDIPESPRVDDEVDESYTQAYIKRRINSCFYNGTDIKKLKETINGIKDIDLLNVYSAWNKLLFLYKNEEEYEELLQRIKGSIGKLNYVNKDDYFEQDKIPTELIKLTLENELSVASQLIQKNNYYLFNIKQDDIFDYIKLFLNSQKLLFPVFVNLEYIEMYLSLKYNFKSDFFKNSIELYALINDVELSANHPAWTTNVSLIQNFDYCINQFNSNQRYSTIYSITNNRNVLLEDSYKAAVMSVKMPHETIADCDRNAKYPQDYNFSDLRRSIKVAKKYKAQVLVMPEFCIPNVDMIKVLDCCIKNEISLVGGLTHSFVGNVATNYIMIYDHILKMCLLKAKNYYPQEEKEILAMNGFKPNYIEPYYFKIDNGLIHYATMTCFDATNIKDRSFLCDKVDTVFMPVYNRDTSYFSSIVSSMARDLSCFVIQANNSEYGDSRITGPMDTIHKEIVQLKGGDNCFTVIGNLDYDGLEDRHLNEYCENILLDELASSNNKEDILTELESVRNKAKKSHFKSLSAGNRLFIRLMNHIK